MTQFEGPDLTGFGFHYSPQARAFEQKDPPQPEPAVRILSPVAGGNGSMARAPGLASANSVRLLIDNLQAIKLPKLDVTDAVRSFQHSVSALGKVIKDPRRSKADQNTLSHELGLHLFNLSIKAKKDDAWMYHQMIGIACSPDADADQLEVRAHLWTASHARSFMKDWFTRPLKTAEDIQLFKVNINELICHIKSDPSAFEGGLPYTLAQLLIQKVGADRKHKAMYLEFLGVS